MARRQLLDVVSFLRSTGATRFASDGSLVGVDFSGASIPYGGSAGTQVPTVPNTFTFILDYPTGINRHWVEGDLVHAQQISGGGTYTLTGTVSYYDKTLQQLNIAATAITGSGDSNPAIWRISSLTPRLNYNPTTLTPRGILIEEQRTNLIRNNTMQGAAVGVPGTLPTFWAIWAYSGLTTEVVGKGVQNGISYFDIRIYGTTNNTFFVMPFDTTMSSVAAGERCTLSAWASIVSGSLTNITNARLGTRWFVSGVSTSGTSTAFTLTSTLTRYNHSDVAPTNTTGTHTTFNLDFASGVAIDITVRIGMPQLEKGMLTSLIPTYNSTATRNSDVVKVNDLYPWFSSTEGTLFVEADLNATTTDSMNRVLAGIGRDVIEHSIYLWRNSSGSNIYTSVIDNNVGQFTNSAGTVTVNNVFKYAASWKANDFAACLNGGTVSTDTTGTIPTTLSTLAIGNGPWTSSNNWMNGHIRKLAYYPYRISNTRLQQLTGA